MAIRVAINGFGRIGRLVLRRIIESNRTDIDVIAINDGGSITGNALLLQRDSVHGNFNFPVEADNNNLLVNKRSIQFFSDRNPENLPWKNLAIDVVLECTGHFTDRDRAAVHLKSGAKKVLVSAPAKGADKTIVYGVNHQSLTAGDSIVSNASCTTNCLAPLAYVLNNKIGIEKGFMTSVHAYTSDQRSLDANHPDPRRARTCSMSLIPTSTGAAKGIGLVLPELDGKLDGTAVRVPIPNVSMVDLTFIASRATDVEELNSLMKSASDGSLRGILGYNELPLVSIDFNHDSNSSVFDSTQTQIVGGDFVRVLSWYDNEWGFASRMVDTAVAMVLAP